MTNRSLGGEVYQPRHTSPLADGVNEEWPVEVGPHVQSLRLYLRERGQPVVGTNSLAAICVNREYVPGVMHLFGISLDTRTQDVVLDWHDDQSSRMGQYADNDCGMVWGGIGYEPGSPIVLFDDRAGHSSARISTALYIATQYFAPNGRRKNYQATDLCWPQDTGENAVSGRDITGQPSQQWAADVLNSHEFTGPALSIAARMIVHQTLEQNI